MADDDKPEQAETTEQTEATKATPLRTLVIRTDGARMEIQCCTMGLWEMKAILEEMLGITKQRLAQVAQAGQSPQAPAAEAPAEVEEPAEDAVGSG